MDVGNFMGGRLALNPFARSAQFSYNSASPDRVSEGVRNSMGRRIAVIPDVQFPRTTKNSAFQHGYARGVRNSMGGLLAMITSARSVRLSHTSLSARRMRGRWCGIPGGHRSAR